MSLWSLKDLLVLDLSNNSLVGSLPPDFGNLDAITLVDLSRNRLSRSIPTTVGDLQKLIYLSLAFNELQGFIPEPLGKMISLESANLCNNILSGEIPSKGPFLNFTSQSFMGNDELCGGFLFRPCKARRRRNNVPTQVESLPATTILARISYIEIERATQGFDQCNLLGRGGFGSVYKGIFANEMVLAIKVFNLQIEGAFKSFDTECEVLRNLRHRNLTKVISSCSNMDFKALLVEYMPNGSLEQWLHSDDYYLNMIQRLDIMIDVTSALEYLRSIMHGIMLMETFTRKKPYDEMFQENLSMRNWVCNSIPATPEDIIDATLLEPQEIDFKKKLHCVSSILELALNCTAESPNERLNMKYHEDQAGISSQMM
ncbi:putative lrr receptor-like serinethreonine-protein kinase [Nicotiana attenuata]|uniref:Lrr receptor-like serinethreonine-protein kinase n=1 Tax=Nicotiana attenuata TaxID=49451 RepID=A0A1J6K4E5_NICAT|nr:putative lrr receptor-like serinethreonine-protein kinase [Nicotiana attenuata]